MSQASPIPQGYNSISVYLVVPDCNDAIILYQQVFGARLTEKIGDDDSVMHAEVRIGNSIVMLSDENPEWNTKSPLTLGGTPVSMYLYVEDADATFAKAIENDMEVIMPMTDMFWGDRYGQVKDPFGHLWSIATHKEDLTAEEIELRRDKFFAEQGGCG